MSNPNPEPDNNQLETANCMLAIANSPSKKPPPPQKDAVELPGNAKLNKENNNTPFDFSLQQAITQATKGEWTGELKFLAQIVYGEALPSQGSFQEINLLTYLSRIYKGTMKIAFDPIKYPVGNCKFTADNAGWNALKIDLIAAGRNGHHDLKVSGLQKGKKQAVSIVCKRYSTYDTNASVHQERNQDAYRIATFTANQKKAKEERCPFRFNLGVDQHCFFLKCGTGCACHKFHPKLPIKQIGASVGHLTREERQQIATMQAAKATNAVARNIHYVGTGTFFTRGQMRYAKQMEETANKTLVDNGMMGPTDDFIGFLQNKEGVNSMILLGVDGDYQEETAGIQKQAAKKETEVLKESAKSGVQFKNQIRFCQPPPETNRQEEHHLEDFRPGGKEELAMKQYELDNRTARNIQEHQASMIGCAWTIASELRTFRQFHSVLCIDGTEDTNKECRSLVTVSVKDSEGKWHVVLRVLTPNARAWVFRWIFQSVMPTLLGKHALEQVQVLLTDGDSQEYSQLDNALETVFPNAIRNRCGWHIVDRGLNRHNPGRAPSNASSKVKQQCQNLRKQVSLWLYSFMKDGCETRGQYEISKALLIQFLQSDKVVQLVGQDGSEAYLRFLRDHVFDHEERYCFYKRQTRRHFDICMNTGHEGTNNGIKNSAIGTGPQQSVETSVKNQMMQSEIKGRELGLAVAALHTKSKLWTDMPVADKVTNMCVSELQHEINLCHNYCSIQDSSQQWRVLHPSGDKSTHQGKDPRIEGIYPKFRCVRHVSLGKDGRLRCTCYRFERFGLPCRHQFHILNYHRTAFRGLTEQDVAVTWWTSYLFYFGSQEVEHQELSKMFAQQVQNDVQGPRFHQPIPPSTYPFIKKGIHIPAGLDVDASFFADKALIDCCINFNSATIHGALQAMGKDGETPSNMMSQLSQSVNDAEAIDDELFSSTVLGYANSNQDLKDHSAYETCNPVFRELCKVIDASGKPGDKEQLITLMDGLRSDILKRQCPTVDGVPQGRIISSNLAASKKKKTHGADPFKKK